MLAGRTGSPLARRLTTGGAWVAAVAPRPRRAELGVAHVGRRDGLDPPFIIGAVV